MNISDIINSLTIKRIRALFHTIMESNRDEASRCVELTRIYIKKKDLDNAWKFSVKAHKLYPTPETKRELPLNF